MFVIGTAGHVDHGKSTLVETLTGINPDRLDEEQERQLTIDLGFAWLDLPDGKTIGIVDVPGHEDFIENMLAGVGGIDAALLVVAADEGVMPQTREHLAILDLLDIPELVVAMTKTDMVDDPEWLELVELDIEETLESTHFQDVPIIPVSAHKQEGLDTLRYTLMEALNRLSPENPDGIPRLPVDRVFTMSGFGTIVTGTLLNGNLQIGQTVEIQPSGIQARIRGLQSHNTEVQTAYPGSRTAVNIAGVNRDAVKRGDVITLPAWIYPTRLIDVELFHLPDAPRPLRHNTEIKFFAGTSETMARIRLLFDDALTPGAAAWAQIQLYDDLPLIRDQRFIIRIPSPASTIGGGRILDTAPGRKWKRNQEAVQERFERLSRGTPLDLASEKLIQAGQPLPLSELPTLLDEHDETILIHNAYALHHDTLAHYSRRISRILADFHRDHPLELGLHINTLQSRLNFPAEAVNVLIYFLEQSGHIVLMNDIYLHLPDFTVQYSQNQRQAVEKLNRLFADNPYTPPSYKEAVEIVGEDVLQALIRSGDPVRLSQEVLLSRTVYQEWLHHVYEHLQSSGSIRLADMRDTFHSTRKYLLAFLDHLEARELTKRSDDYHIAGKADWTAFLES